MFITWRLHGSLPLHRYPPPKSLSAGKAFVWMERFLDQARHGPTWLMRKEIARLVCQGIHHGADHLGNYELIAYAVMANHVHLLINPKAAPSKLLRTLKGFTAREANRVLSRTGEPFWQHESYDHWVRDQAELERIRGYIENNPVRAGLASRPEDYPWSSAHERRT